MTHVSIFGTRQASAQIQIKIEGVTHAIALEQLHRLAFDRSFVETEMPGQFFLDVKPSGIVEISLVGLIKEGSERHGEQLIKSIDAILGGLHEYLRRPVLADDYALHEIDRARELLAVIDKLR